MLTKNFQIVPYSSVYKGALPSLCYEIASNFATNSDRQKRTVDLLRRLCNLSEGHEFAHHVIITNDQMHLNRKSLQSASRIRRLVHTRQHKIVHLDGICIAHRRKSKLPVVSEVVRPHWFHPHGCLSLVCAVVTCGRDKAVVALQLATTSRLQTGSKTSLFPNVSVSMRAR